MDDRGNVYDIQKGREQDDVQSVEDAANGRLIEALEEALSRAKAGEYCGGVIVLMDRKIFCTYKAIGEYCASYSMLGALSTLSHALRERILADRT